SYLNGSNPCDIISSPRWLWFLLDIKTHYTLFYQGQRGFFIYFDGESGMLQLLANQYFFHGIFTDHCIS
ncbi:MAG: hypothetical protein L6455_12270, partial [Kiritimatiellae bacterium]|nr:hypothetical protein [Kiritimatiellia bacterium]